jgi:hypothetical protein
LTHAGYFLIIASRVLVDGVEPPPEGLVTGYFVGVVAGFFVVPPVLGVVAGFFVVPPVLGVVAGFVVVPPVLGVVAGFVVVPPVLGVLVVVGASIRG